jgi:hypothetical protein
MDLKRENMYKWIGKLKIENIMKIAREKTEMNIFERNLHKIGRAFLHVWPNRARRVHVCSTASAVCAEYELS